MTMSYLDTVPARSSELARRMHLSRQRIHAVTSELRIARLVQLVPDPTSGRDKPIQLTAVGERRRSRVVTALKSLNQHAVDHLGTEEIVLLCRLLVRLIDLPAPSDKLTPGAPSSPGKQPGIHHPAARIE